MKSNPNSHCCICNLCNLSRRGHGRRRLLAPPLLTPILERLQHTEMRKRNFLEFLLLGVFIAAVIAQHRHSKSSGFAANVAPRCIQAKTNWQARGLVAPLTSSLVCKIKMQCLASHVLYYECQTYRAEGPPEPNKERRPPTFGE